MAGLSIWNEVADRLTIASRGSLDTHDIFKDQKRLLVTGFVNIVGWVIVTEARGFRQPPLSDPTQNESVKVMKSVPVIIPRYKCYTLWNNAYKVVYVKLLAVTL